MIGIVRAEMGERCEAVRFGGRQALRGRRGCHLPGLRRARSAHGVNHNTGPVTVDGVRLTLAV